MPSAERREFHYVLRVVPDGAAEVAEAAAGDRGHYLGVGEHVVGAGGDADVRLVAEGTSRRHASLEVLPDGGVVVTDLGSRNGTFVDGRRVVRVAVADGARLVFGRLAARLEPLGGGRGAIAIAGLGGGDDPSRGQAPSTVGVSVEERVVRSLRQALRERLAGAGDDTSSAMALARRWVAELLLERVEIWRRAGAAEPGLVAVAGRREAVEREPDASFTAPAPGEVTWRIDFWGPEARRLERLAATLGLAVELFAAPSSSAPARASAAVAPVPVPEPGTASPAVQALYRRAGKVARGDISLLLGGESGSGKEVLARWIHRASPRAAGPFVALNCAALPQELLEAELFGIEAGVATGVTARPGLVEAASGGTLFLDEVGDMALATQAKVLRVLQERRVYRVGARAGVDVDVRFVAATHRDLERWIVEERFRGDLYHRLAGHVLHLPALRERREDVPLLAAHFFHRELAAAGVSSPGMTAAALAALVACDWPGNVRQLENEIRQAVLLVEPGEPLDVAHLSPAVAAGAGDDERPLRLAAFVERAEREAFVAALTAAAGDPARAIAQLGVSRATFYRRLKELGLGEE